MKLQYKSSTDSSHVESSKLDQWVKHSIQLLTDHPEVPYTTVNSGDSFVIVIRMHDEDGGGFHIIKTNNYKETYLDNVVFNKDQTTEKFMNGGHSIEDSTAARIQ